MLAYVEELKTLTDSEIREDIASATERVEWYRENVGEARDRDLETLRAAQAELASRGAL